MFWAVKLITIIVNINITINRKIDCNSILIISKFIIYIVYKVYFTIIIFN